ncbi:MAG: FAD-binding protein, partial [Cyclobacteriaceae bacterium]
MKTYDFLVIGSGIAGLMSAIKVASANNQARVAVITKSEITTSNTRMAQGGVAVTLNGTDAALDQHVQDTLRAGAGLCNEPIVRMVVDEGAKRIQELIDWGVRFDQSMLHMYDLAREGGHSTSRILHHKDKTGEEIQRILLSKAHALSNIQLLSHHHALDLIIEKTSGLSVCKGAHVLSVRSGEIQPFLASVTLIATGGIGQIYPYSTNPVIATGDGIAMALRARAKISGMEFIQFHPTAFYSSEKTNPVFLISEAVRGFGAYLMNNQHKRFMFRYDELGELACRDRVALAIETEMNIAEI